MDSVAPKYLKVPLNNEGLDTTSTRNKRIGLYGGSFNPPHSGHLLVAKTALTRLKLDAVWWLVSPGNPLKDHSALAPLNERITASEDLIDTPKIFVTAFEGTLGSSNSAEMLDQIVYSNAETHFVWIMGADNLENFHAWNNWQQIMNTLPVAVIDRPQFSKADQAPAAKAFLSARLDENNATDLALSPPPAWVFIHGERSHLSSTMLRNRQDLNAM